MTNKYFNFTLVLLSIIGLIFILNYINSNNNNVNYTYNNLSPILKGVYQGGLNVDDNNFKWIVNNHNFIVTRHLSSDLIKKIRSFNSSVKVLEYVKLHGVSKNSSLDKPFYDKAVKDNLFWRNDKGQFVYNKNNGWFVVNVTNPIWDDDIVEVLKSDDERYNLNLYDGVMLDVTSFLYPSSITSLPKDYDYKKVYASFNRILNRLNKEFPDKIIFFNGYNHWSLSNLKNINVPSYVKNLRGIDLLNNSVGISFEGFTHSVGGKKYENNRIIQQIYDFKNATVDFDAPATFIDFIDIDDLSQRITSLAVYYLVYNKNSIYTIFDLNINSYSQDYPEYYVNLRKPLENFSEKNGVFKRKFENGFIIVNLGNNDLIFNSSKFSYKLSLYGGGFWDNKRGYDWKKFDNDNISIKAGEGIILK